ncbi:Asp/Glu racemase [Roseovarius sp.]|uniref:maleate cis-trans isomerase family protein n=1 Tax=Roseovarius sp. TaxID=1486281 RepID=UPI000C3FC4D2|nr:Asp/Glu racemase [Roseovarius sp.]MAO27525.1 Asp/Glu racemase [Roseovarius sp.]MAZ21900.1 Asp/Glu racemase [Roseovarius sp.]
MNDAQHIETLGFATDEGLGSNARIGLIVLQTDQTMEHELSGLLHDEGVALYHARIPNDTEVTPETLRRMEQDLPTAAALLPGNFGFDAIGYGCTSGTTMIGEERVSEILRATHPTARTSNPLSACKAALAALRVRRIALITPYAPDVTREMQDNLQAAGIEINAVATFDQGDDFVVARITSAAIRDAILTIGARDDCDAVFVSCTSLRALPVIAETEAQLGKPVLSSNQVLGWHLARLAGLTADRPEAGQLFKTQLVAHS